MTWGGKTYTVSYSYNTLGKPNQVTYPLAQGQTNPFTVQYGYSYGYTASAQNYTGGVGGTTFWELTPSTTNMDSWGHTIDETLGTTTAVRIQSAYDAVTSWINTRTVGSGGSLNNIQNLGYQWDLNGNLSQRQDITQSLTEVFNYDNLNRLQTSTLNGTQNLSVAIDATGNITSRTEGGITYPYTYDTTHTHAVHTVGNSPNQTTYTYDANGNMATRSGNALTWASYNLPTSVTGPSNTSATFYYGPDRQRKEQDANYVVDGESGLEQTIYVFGLYEFEFTPAQSHNKYFIPVPGGTQIIYDIQSVNGAQTTYITADHLGSGNVFLTSSGAASINESYSAYGYRRSSNWSGPLSTTSSDYTTIASTTRRGYTDAFHEMLDNLSLIHMNGRVYDPVIGRFLSPDPVVTQVGDSQRGNPYSYVENRALTMTDPTGLQIACAGDNCNTNQTPRAWGCSTGCDGQAFDWGGIGAGAVSDMQWADENQSIEDFMSAANAEMFAAIDAGVAQYNANFVQALSGAVDTQLNARSGTPTSIYVGFYGATLSGSSNGPGNIAEAGFAASLGATMFDSTTGNAGSSVSSAAAYVDAKLQDNPNSPVYIFGYSAGGDNAVQLANTLNVGGISVTGLLLFDPHSADRPVGNGVYYLPSNVQNSLDIFQQNPALPGTANQFQGGALAYGNNINLTGSPVNHTTIVQYALLTYAPQIYAVMGH